MDKFIEENNTNILINIKNEKTNLELLNYLSIRKSFAPDDVLYIKEDYVDKLNKYNKKKEKVIIELTEEDKKILKLNSNANSVIKKISHAEETKNIEEAQKLCLLLSDRRAHEFQTWIEVGMCLFNISPSLKDTWITFSKKSQKFVKGVCDTWWLKFRKGDLSIGSLHLWASLDNPYEYKDLKSTFLSTYIYKSLSETTQDIAQVIFEMYKHKYAYVPINKSNGLWYEFSNHRWAKSADGSTLRNRIGFDVLTEYIKLSSYCNKIFLSDNDESKREDALDKSQKLNLLTLKLRDITFKNKLMDELKGFFTNLDFENNLDVNPKLLGFNNGIYDLSAMAFRDGRPEDMVSMSCQIDFPEIEYDDEDENIIEIYNFFAQIFPNEDTRNYALKLFASVLDGTNLLEEFYIFTGGGGNGKSKLTELFTNILGDYAGTLGVSYITNKRAASNSANPELLQLYGKRFIGMQETDDNDKINTGIVKEITGGDKMQIRGLYANPKCMKFPGKCFLSCNNKPKIDATDDGTWRRIRILPFKSKFVDNPSGPYEFKRDNYLSDKMNNWKEGFILILLKYYKQFINDGGLGKLQINPENGEILKDKDGKNILKLPFEVLHATNEYKKDSDIYTQFKDDRLIEMKDGLLKLDMAYQCFTEWYSLNALGGKVPNRPTFKKEMDKSCLKNCYQNKGVSSGWVNWAIKNDEEEDVNVLSKSEL